MGMHHDEVIRNFGSFNGTYEGHTSCFVCDEAVSATDIKNALCPLCNTVLNHTTIKCTRKSVIKGFGALNDGLSKTHANSTTAAMRPQEGGLLGRVQITVESGKSHSLLDTMDSVSHTSPTKKQL